MSDPVIDAAVAVVKQADVDGALSDGHWSRLRNDRYARIVQGLADAGLLVRSVDRTVLQAADATYDLGALDDEWITRHRALRVAVAARREAQ